MTRTVSATITTATAAAVTTPVYLIRMGWTTERRICTWDQNITWNSETWTASGASIEGLKAEGGRLVLPNGDGDPWLALVHSELALDRTVQVYEHHTYRDVSPNTTDAVLLFSGRMDSVRIKDIQIEIDLIEGRKNKGFPPGSLGPPTYNWLLPPGTRLIWGPDTITVN